VTVSMNAVIGDVTNRNRPGSGFVPNGPEGWLRSYLLALIVSNTLGSSNVEVSPSSRPSATSRSNRRMILPLRVFGSSGTT
jgi:hypothetical protein